MQAPSSTRSPQRQPRFQAHHDADAVVAISSRCSFETFDAFRCVESELKQHQHETAARDIRRRPTKYIAPDDPSKPASPVFVSSVKSESQYALKTEAARRNDHTKTQYAPPSDFQHRVESPPATWKKANNDFLAKFHLHSNQDLRSRTALDQEGFFSESGGSTDRSPRTNGSACGSFAATQLVKADEPGARSPQRTPTTPSKPDFQTRLPHTTRKSSNIELRLETILDQDGLLPQLREIRDHKYRDEPTTPVRFHATFKPAPSLRPIGTSSSDSSSAKIVN